MNEHMTIKAPVSDFALGRSGNDVAMLLLKIGTIIAEVLLIAHAATGHGWETLALGHVGIIASLTVLVLLLERSQIETGALQTFTLLTFAGGPIGGAAALLGEQLAWRPKADALESWYNTMAPKEAPAVTLVDLIIDGRLVQQRSRLPRPYDALLSSGTMQEKQALLAYLAIEDDEKFVEVALALALRSADQRVRVQAAAVAAYTRARARRRKMGLSGPGLSGLPATPRNI
ncbi:MAG: hypothetical protein ACK4G5_05060 [Devosia sp.]|jgi:hypothetical protein|uniref:hypothetical protein n=1 Tax=Devosia sp. XGJD_8 TaxID=3391187 RepID=UPI0039396F11